MPTALAVLLGVGSSIAAWWMLNVPLRARLELSEELAATTTCGRGFRVCVTNLGWRDAIEVRVVVRAQIPDVASPGGTTYFTIRDHEVPLIASRRVASNYRTFSIEPEQIGVQSLLYYRDLLPADLVEVLLDDPVSLSVRRLFEIREIEDATVGVTVFGTDRFSGARVLSHRVYRNRHIRPGLYEAGIFQPRQT